MIEIDLFPEKNLKLLFRKNFQIQLPKIPSGLIVLCLIFFIVIMNLIVSSMVGFQKKRIVGLEEALAAKGMSGGDFRRNLEELGVLKEEIAELKQFTRKDVLLSKKLNKLSDIVPKNIWLTQFEFTRDSLKLSGTEIIKGVTEAQIWNLMQVLKKDPEFFKGFTDIKLSYTKRRKIGDTEVEDFMIFFSSETKQKR